MFYRLALCALGTLASAASVLAAVHQTVTPYEGLQAKLELAPGQTYLAFMKKKVKPSLDAFEATIQQDPASQSHNYGQLQTNLIAQGAGVAIRIDGGNYIFNVGYLDGSDAENDVKSGRSYGVGPTGAESDPSDLAYLTELENYLRSEPQAAGDFIHALMQVLTNCDPAGWAKLSPAGQIVATDFLAIYTAELDRHLMVNLNPKAHPWEIDLAAATFVSLFDAASGQFMQNGQLVRGSIKQWWAKGQKGSGIGETRRDRIALQKLIYGRAAIEAVTSQIARLTGAGDGSETIQTTLEYLNSDAAPEDMSGGEGESLTTLMTNYLVHVQSNASQIAAQ